MNIVSSLKLLNSNNVLQYLKFDNDHIYDNSIEEDNSSTIWADGDDLNINKATINDLTCSESLTTSSITFDGSSTIDTLNCQLDSDFTLDLQSQSTIIPYHNISGCNVQLDTNKFIWIANTSIISNLTLGNNSAICINGLDYLSNINNINVIKILADEPQMNYYYSGESPENKTLSVVLYDSSNNIITDEDIISQVKIYTPYTGDADINLDSDLGAVFRYNESNGDYVINISSTDSEDAAQCVVTRTEDDTIINFGDDAALITGFVNVIQPTQFVSGDLTLLDDAVMTNQYGTLSDTITDVNGNIEINNNTLTQKTTNTFNITWGTLEPVLQGVFTIQADQQTYGELTLGTSIRGTYTSGSTTYELTDTYIGNNYCHFTKDGIISLNGAQLSAAENVIDLNNHTLAVKDIGTIIAGENLSLSGQVIIGDPTEGGSYFNTYNEDGSDRGVYLQTADEKITAEDGTVTTSTELIYTHDEVFYMSWGSYANQYYFNDKLCFPNVI